MLQVKVKKTLSDFSITADFTLKEPGVTVFFGESGAGKTTLFKMISGTLVPDKGTITCGKTTFFDSVQKVALPPEKRSVACVFQQHRLFSHFSVKNNLLFATLYCNRPFNQSFYEKVVDLLGIRHLLTRRTSSLSGGESQRVAIGRALLTSASILLLDEPLSSLDQHRKTELMGYIAAIAQNFQIPIIYITHSVEELKTIADHVLQVKNGMASTLLTRDEFIKHYI